MCLWGLYREKIDDNKKLELLEVKILSVYSEV